MRDVPAAMEAIWRSGQYIGEQRPIARVTVQRPHMNIDHVSFPAAAAVPAPTKTGTAATSTATTDKHTIVEDYADFLFGPGATVPKELPNVRDVQWQRNLDSDVGECTVTFYNTHPLPIGATLTPDFDERGYYTYNRGDATYASRWGQTKNEWAGMLMPDNLIRTYEGYGFDEALPPERDPHLVLTGVWMIDSVDYASNGTITVKCRDLGRLLMDQIVFPPITPRDFYPLSFHKVDQVSGFIPEKTYITYVAVANGVATIDGTPADPRGVDQPTVGGKPQSTARLRCSYHKSSSWYYEDDDTRQPGFDYVVKKDDYLIKIAAKYHVSGGWRTIYRLNKTKIDTTAIAHGQAPGGHWIYPGETLKVPGYGGATGTDTKRPHAGKDAFDQSLSSYWLSESHKLPNTGSSFEWIQGKLDGKTLVEVTFNPVKDGCVVYLSVHDGKRWITGPGIKQKAIPYRASKDGEDTKAGIPYVEKIVCDKGTKGYKIVLDKPIPNAQLVRLTFHNLPKFGPGDYRAGVQYIHAFGHGPAVTSKQQVVPGKAVPISPFIKGIGDDFNKARNMKSLGRASQTADLWTYKDDGAGKGTYWYRPATPAGDGAAHRKGGQQGGQRYLWAINNLQYRHQRMDGKLRGFGLDGDDNPTWALAARFRQRGTQIYHVEATATRFGFLKINLVRNGVRTTLATKQLRAPIDLASGHWRMRLSLTETTAKVWVVPDTTTDYGEPILQVSDDRFDDEHMGYHLGFATNSRKAGWGTFNAYGNVKGGVFDSFAREPYLHIGYAETGQSWRMAGPAASASGSKKADTWGVASQRAHRRNPARNGERLWALANLTALSQDVSVRCYPNSSTGDKWLLALRATDARNMIYIAVDQAGYLEIHTVLAGVDTRRWRNPAKPAGLPGVTILRATIIDTQLSVYINGDLVYQVDNPDTYGNPAYGSHVGFGSDRSDIVYDVFNAVVPGTSGGGAGTDADPNTTIVTLETVVPAHIEPGAGAKPGTYEDYTDIVKILCAWGGFYWPKNGVQRISDGTTVPYPATKEDPVLGREGVGRVWGDFEQTGTAGVSDLTMELFDKKTLMEGIAYIRDIIGYVFYIDETGAAVWRAPNIYSVGNNIAAYSANPRRTSTMVEIDEKLTLMNLTASVNSKNVRENVFVATADGKIGATAAGWNANPVGLRRVGGWTDQNFATAQECAVMADLITLRQLFSYRTDTVQIPGFPKIQIDDQIRIYERTAAEGYVHYVNGVSSALSLEDGTYTYDLDTHWLGEQPFTHWLFDPNKLSEATKAYLAAIQLEKDGDQYYELPRGTTLPERKNFVIVTDGSSLTRGTGAGQGNDYPSQMNAMLLNGTTSNIRQFNTAGSNLTTAQLTSRAASVVDVHKAASADGNFVLFWEGSYDLASRVDAMADTPELTTARTSLLAAQKELGTATNRYSTDKIIYQDAITIRDDAIAKRTEAKRKRDAALIAWNQVKSAQDVDHPTEPTVLEQYKEQQYLDWVDEYNRQTQRRDLAAEVVERYEHDVLPDDREAVTKANNKVKARQATVTTLEKQLAALVGDEVAVHAAIKAYCLARKAKGWKVAVGTILPRRDAAWTTTQAAQFEAMRTLTNTLIRTHYKEYADAMFDPAADLKFGKDKAYNDATLYQSNHIYLTRAGYNLVAQYAKGAVGTLGSLV